MSKRPQHTRWPPRNECPRPGGRSRARRWLWGPGAAASRELWHCHNPTSAPFLFPAGESFWRRVGKELSGFSGVVHGAGGINRISSGWTLPASHSRPVTSSESRRGLCRLSFEPAPPGTSRPRPLRRCSPRWRRASGGCGPLPPRQAGGDL